MPTAEFWLCSEMVSALPAVSEFMQFSFPPFSFKHSTTIKTANHRIESFQENGSVLGAPQILARFEGKMKSIGFPPKPCS